MFFARKFTNTTCKRALGNISNISEMLSLNFNVRIPTRGLTGSDGIEYLHGSNYDNQKASGIYTQQL